MYHKTTLPSGVRVLTEEVPSVFSVSIGIWVTCGSRYELEAERGISHFIEHLLFKGTKTRTAQDIAREIDSLGGILNAFTSKEYTCFFAKVLENHLPRAVELLADTFQNSIFPPEEMERERQVILQEIHQIQDSPDDYIHDLFYKTIFYGHQLGYPITGAEDVIKKLSRDNIGSFMSSAYTAPRVIVSAAGKLTHGKILDLVGDSFAHPGPDPGTSSSPPSPVSNFLSVNFRDLEQVHCCLGIRGLPVNHDQRYTFHLLSTILGGGMSSRLFQEIREKRGWAYSIYSFVSSYLDTGLLVVYFASGEKRVKDISLLCADSLKEFSVKAVTDDELARAKEQLKGHLLLSMESSDSRMTKLARGEIYFGRYITVEDIISGIDKVTAEDVRALAKELFQNNTLCMATLGPIREDQLFHERLSLDV